MFWDKQPARMDHVGQGSFSPWLVCDVIQSFSLSICPGGGLYRDGLGMSGLRDGGQGAEFGSWGGPRRVVMSSWY